MKKIFKGSHFGSASILGKNLGCAVLEDRTRILFDSEFLGHSLQKQEWRFALNIDEIVDRLSLPRYQACMRSLGWTDRERENLPIKFKGPQGIISGYDASFFANFCYLQCWHSFELNNSTEMKKEVMFFYATMFKGLTYVGIFPLIDEMTGYQYLRGKTELRELFNDIYEAAKIKKMKKVELVSISN